MTRGLVVAAALLRDGRVLAARRTSPPHAAGRWELPGGKVEPGETATAALERELVEELGVDVEVTGWLPGRVAIDEHLELAVATAVPAPGQEPRPREHDRLHWVDAVTLGELDWLEPDRPFLPALAALLATGTGPRLRAVLFEEDGARAVATRLARDGYAAHLERERLAGEDDDEDHPWAVVTDAPAYVVEVLLDEHDGWLDEDEPGPAPGPAPGAAPTAPPPPLPRSPRRGSLG